MHTLIPAPADLQQTDDGPFPLAGPVRLVVPELPAPVPAALADLQAALAESGVSVDDGADREIVLRLTGEADHTEVVPLTVSAAAGEAYELRVTAEQITLGASAPAGLAHALTTLARLVREAGSGGDAPVLAAAVLTDRPRYPWRGLSLDVVRHFFDVATVVEVLDLLAAYKLNALHLHLTDDQAWRLELASRPRLTEVSGLGQVDGSHDDPGRGGGEPGFYTLDDWQTILGHAAARGITVIPEVDVPGHTHAALVAYPELTPEGVAPEPYTGAKVGFSQITLAQEATLPFLRDVFDELATRTPGPYLHGGGDEALVSTAEDYRDMVAALGKTVDETGKTLVVWQEAAAGELPGDAVVQYWAPGGRATDALVDAAARGHDVLMSPGDRVYLDMKYQEDYPLGLAWAGTVEVADTWGWDPDRYLDGVEPERVRGVEAAVWTETLTTREELFTMLLPRLPAAAEVAWSPQEARDAGGFAGFARRLAAHAPQWQRRGWAFHPSEQIPWA